MRLALLLAVLCLSALLFGSCDCRSSRSRSKPSSGSGHGIDRRHHSSSGHQRKKDGSSEGSSHRGKPVGKDHSSFLLHERNPNSHSGRSNRTVVSRSNATRESSHSGRLPNLRNTTIHHPHNKTNFHAGGSLRKNTTAHNHLSLSNATRVQANTTVQHNRHANSSKHNSAIFPTRNELITNSTRDKILGKPNIRNTNHSHIHPNITKLPHNKTHMIEHNGIAHYNTSLTSAANHSGIYHNKTRDQPHRLISNSIFPPKHSNIGFQNVTTLPGIGIGSKGNVQHTSQSLYPINNSQIIGFPFAPGPKPIVNTYPNTGLFVNQAPNISPVRPIPSILSSHFSPPPQITWSHTPHNYQPSFNYYENRDSGFQNFNKKKDKKKKKKFKFDISLEDFSLEDLDIDKDKIKSIIKGSAKNLGDKLKILHKHKLIPKLPTRRLYVSSFPQVQQELSLEPLSNRRNITNFSKKISTNHYNRLMFGLQSPLFAGLESVQTSIYNISRNKRDLSPKGKATVKIINDFFKHERDCNDTILEARRRRSVENLGKTDSGLDLKSIYLRAKRDLSADGKNTGQILKKILIGERDYSNNELQARKRRHSDNLMFFGNNKNELEMPNLPIIHDYKFGDVEAIVVSDTDFVIYGDVLPRSNDGEIHQIDKSIPVVGKKDIQFENKSSGESELIRSGKDLGKDFFDEVNENSSQVIKKNETNKPINHSGINNAGHNVIGSNTQSEIHPSIPILSGFQLKNITKLKEINESLEIFLRKAMRGTTKLIPVNESLDNWKSSLLKSSMSSMEGTTGIKKRSTNGSEIYNVLISNESQNLTIPQNVSMDLKIFLNGKNLSSYNNSHHNDIYGHFNSTQSGVNITSAITSYSEKLLNRSLPTLSTFMNETEGSNNSIFLKSINISTLQEKRNNVLNKSEGDSQNSFIFPVNVTSNISVKSESSEMHKLDDSVRHAAVDGVVAVNEEDRSSAVKADKYDSVEKVGLDGQSVITKGIGIEYVQKTSTNFDQHHETKIPYSPETTTGAHGLHFLHLGSTEAADGKAHRSDGSLRWLDMSGRSTKDTKQKSITERFRNERVNEEPAMTTLLFGGLKILGVERKDITGTTPLPIFVLSQIIPRQDTVLIQAPYRHIACPSGYKIARGVCRKVWGW